MNVGNAPGATTIRKCCEQHSGTNFKTRTSPVFTCIIFQTKKSNSPQVNQTRYPENLAGYHRKLIKKHLDKSRNTTIGNLLMRIQGLQLTKDKPPDTDLEDKVKTNLVYCTTVDPSTTKEGKIYSDICRRFPTTSSRGKKYIYVMYVYDCNSILST